MADLDDKIINMVNKNSTYNQIADYILEYYPKAFTMKDAKTIAEFLVENMGFSKEEIFNRKADKTIFKYARINIIKQESVLQPDEEKIENPLKTKKRKTTVKIVSGILGFIIFIGGVKYAINVIKDFVQENHISHNIGVLASDVGSSDFEYERNIANQNIYRIGYDYDRHTDVFAYNNDNTAMDIINVCVENPELFDVTIHNLYSNTAYNKLQTMDEVIFSLKNYTKDDESLSVIYDQIKDCNVFFDYLVKKGFLDPNDPDYFQILEDIEQYKSINNGVAFTSMSEEAQKRLYTVIDKYKENRKIQYDRYENIIDSLAEAKRDNETESFGGR